MTGILPVLKFIAALATVITGGIALVKPKSVFGFTGLQAEGGRGISEIRSIMGAGILALGVVPMIFPNEHTYMMLGIAYLAVAAVRFFSMFFDHAFEASNKISLAVEIVLGVILVIPG